MSAFIINPYAFVTWTPANITTDFWLDAEDASTITLSSGVVSQWNDKSGNGKHATQPTAAERPTYSATSFFGKAGLTFDGVDDALIVQTSVMQNNTAHGVYWIMQRLGSGDTDGYNPTISVLNLDDNDRGALHYIKDNTQGACYPYYSGPSQQPYDGAGQYANNVGYIHSFQDNATGFGVWKNGTLENTTSGITAPDNTNNGYVLAKQVSPFRASNIIISEVIAVANATTSNRERIEGYLAHKWGLTGSLPANHPYKTTPPAPQ